MRARGSSLIEGLVAVTIAALAVTIALGIYDRARRSIAQGENTTEQQQSARVALHLLAADIREAGLNTNPDGDPARPDEPIEGAWPTAISLRGDFDALDPVESNDPERALEGTGSAFATVSTGNDEIRTYALSRPESSDTLLFRADVGDAVRDGSVEEVSLDRVSVTHDRPPYTLYRITLDNDPAECCSGGFAVRTPLIDNVRALRFRYYGASGAELAPAGGADDPAARAMRASIRRVCIELEVRTRRPGAVTRRYDTFALGACATPRNRGPSIVETGE